MAQLYSILKEVNLLLSPLTLSLQVTLLGRVGSVFVTTDGGTQNRRLQHKPY